VRISKKKFKITVVVGSYIFLVSVSLSLDNLFFIKEIRN